MSDLFVGCKVVCVDDSRRLDWPENKGHIAASFGIVMGQVYVIRWLGNYTSPKNGSTVFAARVSGITRDGEKDTPFMADRFRPLETKAISVFRKIAQDVTDGKYVEIKEDA